MIIRACALGAALLLSAFCFAAPDRPGADKGKNSLKALFDGIPKDLAAKVKDNPVRCDRVNDWLQENVNGKGKTVEIRVEVAEIFPYRKEGAYYVEVVLRAPKVNLLNDDWRVHFGDGVSSWRASANFTFVGVNAADAEKLVDSTHVTIQAKVKEVKLPRFSERFSRPSTPLEIGIVLEDVQLDGKKWTPFAPKEAFGGNPFGNGPDGGKKKKIGDPFDGGPDRGKKKKGGNSAQNKDDK